MKGDIIMKKFMVGSIAFAAVAAGPAMAADLAVKRPVYRAPPPVAVFTWTGCYIGGHIGGGWTRKTVSASELAPGISFTGSTSGFLGGGQVGCNYQFASNWVIGIEGDGSAAGIKGEATTTVLGITGTARAKTDWLASVTGRLGWAAGPLLVYAKGGVAWAGDKYSADIPIFDEHITASETRTGWTVGGGLEYGFTNNWSAKVEYLYVNLGSFDTIIPGTVAGFPDAIRVHHKYTDNIVRVGLNYRFGGPVYAAY